MTTHHTPALGAGDRSDASISRRAILKRLGWLGSAAAVAAGAVIISSERSEMSSVLVHSPAWGRSNTCPVEKIGRKLTALSRLDERLGDLKATARGDKTGQIERRIQTCWRRRSQLEDQVSRLKPESLAGAMVLIGIAHGELGFLRENEPLGSAGQAHFDALRQRAARCLYSAYELIEDVCGVSRAELDHGYYMPDELARSAWAELDRAA